MKNCTERFNWQKPYAESDTEKVAPLRPYLQNERQQKDKDPGVRNDGWFKQKRTATPRMVR